IYAGSDVILVPSIFEPCGLTQLISMRYGALPVVRRTGGLADSVFDHDDDQEKAQAAGMETNGFSFDGQDEAGIAYALVRGLEKCKGDGAWWGRMAARNMQQDWSWNRPALEYIELYWGAAKKS
ncbi:starch synthase, partial [Cymbomonas tetramitiformis]